MDAWSVKKVRETGSRNETERDEARRDEARPAGILARLRAALAESAWGALAGKGAIYAAGFALLAAVGSGKLGCMGAAGAKSALVPPAMAAVAPSAGASASTTSAATATATATTSAGASASGAGAGAVAESADAGASAASASDGGAATEGAGRTAEGKVLLNRATEEDLRHLPGIGATRAKAILALRAKLGRFSRVEDLMRVKGIGRRSLARLRPMVIID